MNQEGGLVAGGDTTQQINLCLQRLQAGDKSVIDELITLAYERVRGLARHILRRTFPSLQPGHQTTTAHQEGMIRLFQALLNGFKPESRAHLISMFSEMVRRALLDLCRQEARLRREVRPGDRKQPSPDSEERDSPTFEANRTEDPGNLSMWAELHDKVSDLDEMEQMVFRLYWYAGMKQQDIAELLSEGREQPVTQKQVSRLWLSACQILPQHVAL